MVLYFSVTYLAWEPAALTSEECLALQEPGIIGWIGWLSSSLAHGKEEKWYYSNKTMNKCHILKDKWFWGWGTSHKSEDLESLSGSAFPGATDFSLHFHAQHKLKTQELLPMFHTCAPDPRLISPEITMPFPRDKQKSTPIFILHQYWHHPKETK